MIRRASMMLHKKAILLYLDKRSEPIVMVPYASAYEFQFIDLIRRNQLSLKEVFIPVEGDLEMPIPQSNKYLKLYLDKQGRVSESQQVKQHELMLGEISDSFEDNKVLGMQSIFEYSFIIICRVALMAGLISIFKLLYVDTRIENFNMDMKRPKRF